MRLILLLGAVLVTAWLCVSSLMIENRAKTFSDKGIALGQARSLLASDAPPRLLLAGAEALDLSQEGAPALGVRMMRAGLAKQPDQPYAWASLAYFQTRLAGNADALAIDALRRSVRQCGYCDRDLLRWRLSFAIEHWDEIPRDLRLDIFRGAEFLRWWHMDGVFLAEAREKAEAKGIDFRGYQRDVVSHIRPHEVRPAE